MNRHFDSREAHGTSQQQDLYVKRKSIEPLPAENFARGALPESLESTLSIANPQAGNCLRYPIEDFAHGFPHDGLPLQNARLWVLTVANKDVNRSIFTHSQETGVQILEGCAEVCVQEENAISPCPQHPVANGETFSTLLVMRQNKEAGVVLCGFLSQGECAVLARLDDNNNLVRKVPGSLMFSNPL